MFAKYIYKSYDKQKCIFKMLVDHTGILVQRTFVFMEKTYIQFD